MGIMQTTTLKDIGKAFMGDNSVQAEKTSRTVPGKGIRSTPSRRIGKDASAVASGIQPGLLKNRTSLGQNVLNFLRQAMADQMIPPGSRLVEARIAERLGISRTPVREAMHKLEREDWLVRLPKGGYRVRELTLPAIEETFGIRSVLEAYAARLAAERHKAGEILGLNRLIDQYQQCLASACGDLCRNDVIGQLSRINTDFHDRLYQLSRSTKLSRLINSLRGPINRFRPMILQQPGMAEESNQDHRNMVAAMKRRDGEAVEQLVREHILRGKEAILRTWTVNC